MHLYRFALALVFSLPVSLGAQGTAYRFTPADTVRYVERTDVRLVLQVQGSANETRMEHEATISMVGGGGDTVRAWYEALRIRHNAQGQDQVPDVGSLIRRPFTLHISPSGKVEMRAAPPMPASLKGVSDLTHQFDDFLIGLPEGALVVGATWADTVIDDRPFPTSEAQRAVHERSYRALRDTVVEGRAGIAIEVRERIRLLAVSPGPRPGLMAHTVLEGEESGIAVVAAAEGRLLGRTKTGKLAGRVDFRGAATPISIPQTYEYTSAIRLVR